MYNMKGKPPGSTLLYIILVGQYCKIIMIEWLNYCAGVPAVSGFQALRAFQRLRFDKLWSFEQR